VPAGLNTPIVTSRTFNEPGNAGTFGQYIPAVPLSGGTSLPVSIEGLGGDAAFRTNIGVVNLSDATITATISLFEKEGAKVGNDVAVSVGPHSAVQSGSINSLAGAGVLDVFSARIAATGDFFAYASKLDNITSDPIFVPSSIEPRTIQWIDGVAAIVGSGGTVFRSNLVLANRGTTPASILLELTARGESNPSSTGEVDLAPGQTRYFSDVIPQLFSRDELVGTLTISSSAPVAAWARTYSDRGASGTLGQFIPAFGASDLIGTRGAIFQGLSDNAAVRTNMGFVNIGPAAVNFTVSVFRNDGSLAGTQGFGIGGTSAISLNGLIRTITGGELTEGYVTVTPSSGGAIYAWASYVDNLSTDQTFVRPIALQ